MSDRIVECEECEEEYYESDRRAGEPCPRCLDRAHASIMRRYEMNRGLQVELKDWRKLTLRWGPHSVAMAEKNPRSRGWIYDLETLESYVNHCPEVRS